MNSDWVRRDASVIWHGFTQMAAWEECEPVIVERAEGHELIDVEGRRYLDAISSLWVNTMGHRVPELDAAIVEQLGKVAHSTMLGNGNTIVVEFAEALVSRLPVEGPRIMFASDGASAVEQALKIAFQYWWNLGKRTRTRYLALGNAYHGDTVGALSLGGGGFGTDLFDPLRFPVLRSPGYDDPEWADAAVRTMEREADSLAAVVIEPLVQGAAGMLVANASDVARVVDAAQDLGLLVICDEVATGFGRTGSLFASERCGIAPDLMCLGKGITGGYLPMSATVASERVWEAFLGEDLGERTFYHGHSYGGNALAAAVALRHLELLEQRRVLDNVRERSVDLREQLERALAGSRWVADVRLVGLMGGVELKPPGPKARWGRRVAAAAVRRGVLMRPLGDVMVLMPPLTITKDEIVRIVEVLGESIEEVASSASEL